jgi:hypothetical protein
VGVQVVNMGVQGVNRVCRLWTWVCRVWTCVCRVSTGCSGCEQGVQGVNRMCRLWTGFLWRRMVRHVNPFVSVSTVLGQPHGYWPPRASRDYSCNRTMQSSAPHRSLPSCAAVLLCCCAAVLLRPTLYFRYWDKNRLIHQAQRVWPWGADGSLWVTSLAHSFIYMYMYILYMFQAAMCPSSRELLYQCDTWFMSLWNINQVSHWYNNSPDDGHMAVRNMYGI